MAQNAVAITDKTIGNYLSFIKNDLSAYHNGSMSGFMSSAMLMISESDQLKECLKSDQGKRSLFNAMKFAASTGLSLNPQEGKAALIAYQGKVQYQVMKNGLIDLAMQSGKVEFITCDTVREADAFALKKTMDGDKYEYTPARKDRGSIDGFFAALKMVDGTCHVKYMSRPEVEAHRDSYSSLYKAKPAMSPWSKSFEGMALKTVVKALFRNLSISSDIDKAIGVDDEAEAEPRDVTQAEEIEQVIVEEQPEKTAEPDTKEEEKVNDLF